MVGSAPQPQSQPQPQPSTAPPSAEEEALKRNTDCVYFLASPLTCKKGSECEYRHSDVARVNPRDCYYWLHGNCLNPKCAFRHPPLDGVLGTQKPTPTGLSVPTTQTATAPMPHIPNNSTKLGAVCIYFQKGYCLKGDWCPFLHAPPSLNNKASIALGTTFTAESSAGFKKASSGLDKSVQERNSLPVNVAKTVKDIPQGKQTVEKPAPAALRNELAVNRRVPQTSGVVEFPGYKRAPYASNGIQENWTGHVQQSHLFDEPELNSKDADELSREPSPGFDVLVDDENRESEYYPGDDRYGMSMEHEGGNEYDIDHATDYNMIAAVDDERYQDSLGYDSHERHRGQHPWDHRRGSSERMSGVSHLERRSYDTGDNLTQADQFDLRHRLSKQKQSNGLRSVINHEHVRDHQVGDRNYKGLRRDEKHISVRENTRSSRLQGRITLPGADRTRISGRLSPVKTNIPSNQGRIRDRIKGRVDEAFNNGGKNLRGLHIRDAAIDNITDFAGPKSLAELKNKKNDGPIRQHTTEQQSLGKRKKSVVGDYQQSENSVSFEGPKPLEEILKRKRGETTAPTTTEAENQDMDVIKIEEPDSTYGEENIEAAPNSMLHSFESKIEAEDGAHPEDGVGQESEAYDQGGEEDDYEQVAGEDGEDPYAFDGENEDAAGEYIDEDDDDDDFAKKMGIMYT